MHRRPQVPSVTAMRSSQRRPPGAQSGPPRGPLSWPLITGLASLALLWPLADLTGLPDHLGQPLTAVLLLLVTALVWVLGVGLCRVPRPVLTLTLSGALSGAVLVAASVILGAGPKVPTALTVTAALLEILQATALGAVAGLLAATIQRTRTR